MQYPNIQAEDFELYEIIKREEQRQKEGIELIASENYGSWLGWKDIKSGWGAAARS
jgi:glycine/serine hydroxymethyltransferase